MKNFAPQSGGHPLQLNDLLHLQNAYAEALLGLARTFHGTAGTFVMQGCDTSAGIGFAYTGGYIFLNDEIFRIEPGVIPSGTLFWRIEDDTENPRDLSSPYQVTYQDTFLKDVHFRRKMYLKAFGGSDSNGVNGIYDSSLSIPFYLRFDNSGDINILPRLRDYKSRLETIEADWSTVTLSGLVYKFKGNSMAEVVISTPSGGSIKYKKVKRIINLQISLTGVDTSSDLSGVTYIKIESLPSALRSSTNWRVPCLVATADSSEANMTPFKAIMDANTQTLKIEIPTALGFLSPATPSDTRIYLNVAYESYN